MRDDRAYNALKGGVWADLQLTNTASDPANNASTKIQNTIDSYISGKESAYRQYWVFRNMQPDPSVYDANFIVSLTPAEDDAYTDYYTRQGRPRA